MSKDKLVVIGNSPSGETFELKPDVFNLGKSIMGSWGGNSNPDTDFDDYSKLLIELYDEKLYTASHFYHA